MDIGAGKTRPKADVPGLPARPAGEALGPFHQFFATASVPCPYLPGRAERKLIVELAGHGAPVFYDELSRAGFRRSHRFAYRPACRSCAACVPVRIAVDRFAHTRSTRRVRNTNRELSGELLSPRATVEQFRLFTSYQHSRHCDSDMASMNYGDYRGMVEDTAVRSAAVEFRDPDGTLVAVSLLDRLDDGLSAVYSFFDPTTRPAQSRHLVDPVAGRAVPA